MDQERYSQLNQLCKGIRQDILTMVANAGSGHPGGSLSSVEILATLYFDTMAIQPEQPQDPDRDRFILSKGHAAPVLYSTLSRRGYFDAEHLMALRQFDAILQGHPHMGSTPGLDCSAGSLGQGLSIAAGLALAAKKQDRAYRTYCLLGDGELQEGQVWEAAMTAAHFHLNNLCAIVDLNGVQLDGTTVDIMNVEPVADKFRTFNWQVIEVDGHDLQALSHAFALAKAERSRPTVLVARCIKGKGVSFMEGQAAWHGAAPNPEQLAQALNEIG